MKVIKAFILIIFFIYVNDQVPTGKALNSCGKNKDYTPPDKKEDCADNTGEICCFVKLTKKQDSSSIKTFCAVAPSKIEKSDIEEKIYEYTDYNLTQLECLNSKYIQIGRPLFLLLLILF